MAVPINSSPPRTPTPIRDQQPTHLNNMTLFFRLRHPPSDAEVPEIDGQVRQQDHIAYLAIRMGNEVEVVPLDEDDDQIVPGS